MARQGFGINAHVPTKVQIEKTIGLGCEWIRIDFDWRVIEPARGKYNWGAYDTAVNTAFQRGLKIYGTVAYSPAWLNNDYRECPASASEWAYFVVKCASRYNGKIMHWGLWNEPNLKQFYIGSRTEYLETILKQGSQAIRSVNKNIRIVVGDFATTSSSDWPEWFALAYKNHTLFDIFSWHTYQDSASEIKMRYNMGKLPPFGWILPQYRPFSWYIDKAKAKGKEIWLTETGWKAKESSSKEMKSQRENIQKLLKIQKDIDASVMFVYELQDDANISDKWGMYKADGTPKLAAEWLINNK